MGVISGKAFKARKQKRIEIVALAKKMAKEMADRMLEQEGDPKIDWTKVISKCPQTYCGNHVGPVEPDFGTKLDRNGRIVGQSWCRTCRNAPISHPTRNSLPGSPPTRGARSRSR